MAGALSSTGRIIDVGTEGSIMLELYHHGNSVCAQKVRLALEEKRLDWREHFVDILAGEQFRPEYLRLNPKAVVPTLIHDGAIIRESTVICEYLDDVFPAPALRPADAFGRARMRLWTKLVDESLHAACTAVTFSTYFRFTMLDLLPEKAFSMPADELDALALATINPTILQRKRAWLVSGLDAPDVKGAFKAFDKALADMEQALAEGPWLLGREYSLADIGATPYVSRLENLSLTGMWDSSRPRVAEWYARIKQRPNFATAITRWIPEPDMNAMMSYGAANWPRIERILAMA
ncbi:MAG: glutathione S-transferase family protein [Candidatus Binataceae bacterium]